MDHVAFSGGPDSTALALLLPDAVPVFTDTAWEFPETYAHIDRFEQMTGREVVRITHPDHPDGLPGYIRSRRFLPSHGARFCTRIFKIEAMNRWLGERLPARIAIGLRADEPADVRVGNMTDVPGLAFWYPLRERGMTRSDVLRICMAHDLLPRKPVYMARGGCIGCFYKRRSEVQAMIDLVPDVVDQLQAIEEAVQDERGRFFHMFPNAGASIAEIRAQARMFSPDEIYADALERDDYGAACGLFCNR